MTKINEKQIFWPEPTPGQFVWLIFDRQTRFIRLFSEGAKMRRFIQQKYFDLFVATTKTVRYNLVSVKRGSIVRLWTFLAPIFFSHRPAVELN